MKISIFTLLLIIFSFTTIEESRASTIVPQKKENSKSEVLKEVKGILVDWLDFYGLDIKDFESDISVNEFMSEDIKSIDAINEECFSVVTFLKEDLEYKPLLREYSPNKQYYIPIYEHMTYYDEDSKQYYVGFDDSQNVWLYNTKTELAYLIQFFGVGSIAEGAYWLDNDRMILVGKSYDEGTHCFFYLFDFKKMQRSYFYNGKDVGDKKAFYKHVLEQKGLNVVLD